MMMMLAHRRREEAASDSDSDSDSEIEIAINDNSDDLPQYFCGTLIQRQVDSSRSPPPNLHINTSTANDTSNARSDERNNASQPQTSQSNQDNNNDDNSNRPPSPWGSSTSKQRIINELKDDTSDIHLHLGNYTDNNFKEVNFKYIHQQYANNKYKLSNFRENVKRILMNFLNKTGSFKADEVVIEPWYTSVNNVSSAYALLYLLYMDPKKSRQVENMTAEQIWQSNPLFQQYELEKFETYNVNMKKLTEKRRGLIQEEEAVFHQDMLSFPPKEITSRGYPFWNKHRASKLLEQDERNGVAKEMKPKQLWQSRIEYQDFPLFVFRKHIYQERMKQLAAPFWQHKRNKIAKKKFEEAQEELKGWNQNQFERSMNVVIEEWERINLED